MNRELLPNRRQSEILAAIPCRALCQSQRRRSRGSLPDRRGRHDAARRAMKLTIKSQKFVASKDAAEPSSPRDFVQLIIIACEFTETQEAP